MSALTDALTKAAHVDRRGPVHGCACDTCVCWREYARLLNELDSTGRYRAPATHPAPSPPSDAKDKAETTKEPT